MTEGLRRKRGPSWPGEAMMPRADNDPGQPREATAEEPHPTSPETFPDGNGDLSANGLHGDEEHPHLAHRRPIVTARHVRRPGPKVQSDLVGKQDIQGQRPGNRYVRVCRIQSEDFERDEPGHLVARPESMDARGPVGKAFKRVKRTVIGAPLTTAAAAHERLTKVKALAVLSSDALSSVAYATEEILHVLLFAGLGALALSLPIGAAIVALLIIVGVSYRQTIKAYPHGGGSYIVAKDNLGERPALTAGAGPPFCFLRPLPGQHPPRR